MVESKKIDDRGRITLPKIARKKSHVLIERVDDFTYILKLPRPDPTIKMVLIQSIDRLPDDPEWDKVEAALGRAAYRKLPPPPKD